MISHQLATRWGGPNKDFWTRPVAFVLGRLLSWWARVPAIESAAHQLTENQNVWMLAAADDQRIPSAATASLRKAFDSSEATFKFDSESGGHLRGEDDPRIPQLLQRTMQWMAAARLR